MATFYSEMSIDSMQHVLRGLDADRSVTIGTTRHGLEVVVYAKSERMASPCRSVADFMADLDAVQGASLGAVRVHIA